MGRSVKNPVKPLNPILLNSITRPHQVPTMIYDRSTFIFLTAFVVDLMGIVFERQTAKLDFLLLPAFIKCMASSTNILVRFMQPVVLLTTGGRVLMLQRYICWLHTTPSILILIKFMATSLSTRDVSGEGA